MLIEPKTVYLILSGDPETASTASVSASQDKNDGKIRYFADYDRFNRKIGKIPNAIEETVTVLSTYIANTPNGDLWMEIFMEGGAEL